MQHGEIILYAIFVPLLVTLLVLVGVFASMWIRDRGRKPCPVPEEEDPAIQDDPKDEEKQEEPPLDISEASPRMQAASEREGLRKRKKKLKHSQTCAHKFSDATRTEFKDVLWTCPTTPFGHWNAMIGAEDASDKLRVIANSNFFLLAHLTYQAWFDEIYDTLNDIEEAMKILEDHEEEVVRVDGKTHVFANSFSATNSGHHLSCIVGYLRQLDGKVPEKIAVLKDSFRVPRVMEILELFIPKQKWIVLEKDTVYKFKEAVFLHNEHLNLPEHKDIVEEIVQRFSRISPSVEQKSPARIALVKTRGKSVAFQNHNAFYGDKAFGSLCDKGYIFIRPEETLMREIVRMLRHARHILFSTGSILYTNAVFANPRARIYCIELNAERAYGFVQEMKGYTPIRVSSANLDEHMDEIEKIR